MLKTISACLRSELNSGNYTPIIVVKGNQGPHYVGSSWSYKTKTGKPIYHPNAYHKKGWSSMEYHKSTLRIEVGCDYILSKFRKEKKYKRDKLITEALNCKFIAFS
jgi:hypothetical protein